MKKTFFYLFLLLATRAYSQSTISPLTVEKIMRDPQWIGTSPANPSWSTDGKYLFFNWNPEKAVADSLYYITTADLTPQKTNYAFRKSLPDVNSVRYNTKRTHYVYTNGGDIFLADVKTGAQRRIAQTVEAETNPQFSFNDNRIVYTRGSNLFA